MPVVGYSFSMGKDLAGPANTRLTFVNRPLGGLSLGYLTEDNGEVEIAWMHTNSSAHLDRVPGTPPEDFDIGIDEAHLHFMYMTQDPPWQPFILIGLGATHYAPSGDRTGTTHFSAAIGTGFKWLWTDRIGLRFDARWVPVLAPNGSHIFCDADGSCASVSSHPSPYFYPFLNMFTVSSGLMLRY
jgi:hypothetical protein